MNNPGTKPGQFNKLRWKLTLSYTAVTVGALLAVEVLLLFMVGVGLVMLLNSGFLPAQLIQAASAEYVPVLRFYLVQSPPDQAGIAQSLEQVGAAFSETLPLTFNATDEMLVVDQDGRVLAMRPPDLIENGIVGQPLDFQSTPGLAKPLQAALAGDSDINNLYSIGELDGKVVIAVPVWDDSRQRVLGAWVGMGPRPSIFSLVGQSLAVIGVSLLLFTFFAGVVGMLFGSFATRGLVQRIGNLAETSQEWSQGNFDVSVVDPVEDELGQLAQRLNQMAGQLSQLMESRQELVVIDERNRLARELHDSAKQQAFAAAAQVNAARTLLASGSAESAQSHLDEAERLIKDLRTELGALIQQLSPPALGDQGLAAALRDYTRRWSRQTGIPLDLHIQGERSLSMRIEQTLFRIVQEALANIARHSQAGRATVDIISSAYSVTCEIKDDGIGFDQGRQPAGYGLRSMRERVDALAGELSIRSSPQQGVHLRIDIPLEQVNSVREG